MSEWWGHLAGVLILLLMAVFIAIWIWAWRPRHRRVFDALAEIPLLDGDAPKDGEPLASRERPDDRGPAA